MVASLTLPGREFHSGFDGESVESKHLVPDFLGTVVPARTAKRVDQQALKLPVAVVVADEFFEHGGGLVVFPETLANPEEQHHALDVARGEATETLQRLYRLIEHFAEPTAMAASGQADENSRVGAEHIHVVRRETVGDARVFHRLVEKRRSFSDKELRQSKSGGRERPDPRPRPVRKDRALPLPGPVPQANSRAAVNRKGPLSEGVAEASCATSRLRSEEKQEDRCHRRDAAQSTAGKGPETCFLTVHGTAKSSTLP